MSSHNHISGQIVVNPGSDGRRLGSGPSLVVRAMGGRPMTFDEVHANARRLTACWNAFEGWATEDVEACRVVRGPGGEAEIWFPGRKEAPGATV